MTEHHAKRSPSGGAKRMLYCAAAPEREAHYPDTVVEVPPEELTRQKAPAQWGTACHAILEEAIKAVNVHRFTFGGEMPVDLEASCSMVENTLDYPIVEYDQMCEVAQVALDYAFGAAITGHATWAVNTEQRVYPGKLIGIENDLDGTADVQVITREMIEVIDLKSGRGHVEADDEQLRYYAVGALMNYIDAQGNTDIKTVRTTVVQPLGEDPQAIRSHDYTVDELIDWMNSVVYPAYMNSLDPNAPATPSEKGCKWCKVVDCAERAAWLVGGVTQINQPITRAEPHIPDITTLTDDQLQSIYDYAPLLQSFIKTVDAYITATKKKEPERFPALKFKPTLGNKKWILEGKTLETRLKNWKFKKVEYSNTVIKSPTQMLKIADKETKLKLEKIIMRPETGFKLVPATPDDTDGVDPNMLGIKIDTPQPEPAADPFACLN